MMLLCNLLFLIVPLLMSENLKVSGQRLSISDLPSRPVQIYTIFTPFNFSEIDYQFSGEPSGDGSSSVTPRPTDPSPEDEDEDDNDSRENSPTVACNQRVVLEVNGRTTTLIDDPKQNSCSQNSFDCAEIKTKVFVKRSNDMLREGTLTWVRCMATGECLRSCVSLERETFYAARFLNATDIISIVRDDQCTRDCCDNNVTCKQYTDTKIELDPCEKNEAVTKVASEISTTSLRRNGVCYWNIEAASSEKIEIVFDRPLKYGTYVDIFEDNRLQTSSKGSYISDRKIGKYTSKSNAVTVRLTMDPRFFQEIKDPAPLEIGLPSGDRVPVSDSDFVVSATIKATTSSAHHIVAQYLPVIILSSVLLFFFNTAV